MNNQNEFQIEVSEMTLTDIELLNLITQPASILAEEATESDKLAEETSHDE